MMFCTLTKSSSSTIPWAPLIGVQERIFLFCRSTTASMTCLPSSITTSAVRGASTGVPCRAKAHTAALSGSCKEISVKRVFGWNSGAALTMVTASLISAAESEFNGCGRFSTWKVWSRPDWNTSLIKVSETQALPSFITTGTGRSRDLPLTIAVLAPGFTLT